MLIFGFPRKAHQIAMLMLFCRNCQGTFATALTKLVTKFSLFFVPLFPIAVSRKLTCTRCGTSQKISKADADQLQAEQANPQAAQPHPGQPHI